MFLASSIGNVNPNENKPPAPMPMKRLLSQGFTENSSMDRPINSNNEQTTTNYTGLC